MLCTLTKPDLNLNNFEYFQKSLLTIIIFQIIDAHY